MKIDGASVLIWVYRPFFLIDVQFHFHFAIHQKKQNWMFMRYAQHIVLAIYLL